MLYKEPIPAVPEAFKKCISADRIVRESTENHSEALRRAKADRPDRACITILKSTKVKW